MHNTYYDSDEEAIYQQLVDVCGGNESKKKQSCCNKLFCFFFGKK